MSGSDEQGTEGGEIWGWVGQSISKPDLCPSHQDLFSHLLDLLRLGLNVIFQFVLPPLHHLQPLYLVLQGLPALLLTRQTVYKTNCLQESHLCLVFNKTNQCYVTY